VGRPLVSVVIPTYQRRELVLRAARSALAQRYEPLELLVADDGSTDGTVEALQALADPRLIVVAIEHGGVSAARNAALERAAGSIVAFLDSDDRWFPHHVATVTGMFERRPSAVLATTTSDHASFGRRSVRSTRLVDPLPRLLAGSFVGGISSVAVRTAVLDESGRFATDLEYGEDSDLYRRLGLLGPFCTLRTRTVVLQTTRGSVMDRIRAEGEQFAAADLALARFGDQVRATPRAAELGPRVEGARMFVAAMAAVARNQEALVAVKLREACVLLPELRSEPLLVLGRAHAAFGGPNDPAAGIAMLGRLWPSRSDETAAGLRAYTTVRALASRRPRRAAEAARGISVAASFRLVRRHGPVVALHVWKSVDRMLHTARESPLLASSAATGASREAP
jgi:hypothetical protein